MPPVSITTTSSSNYLREAIVTAHQSKNVKSLLLASWDPKTQQNYNTYIKKWIQYSGKMNIKEPFKASFTDGTAFLSELFHNGKGNCGVIAVARSALSTILPKQGNVTFGKDSNVSRMLRGIFKLRPSLPKHLVTYDPNIVFKYMDSLPTNKDLLLELLTKKLCALLCFLSGQRSQWIGKLKIDKSILSHGTCTFYCFKNNKAGQSSTPTCV